MRWTRITAGSRCSRIVGDGYWGEREQLLLLGAGGSSLALTLYLHGARWPGGRCRRRLVVTNRREPRLEEMREIHAEIGFQIPIDYRAGPDPGHQRRGGRGGLRPGSVVVNATGLGKDRPGLTTDRRRRFPTGRSPGTSTTAATWSSSTRPSVQAVRPGLQVEDGWVYFIHGWTRVIAEVFHIDIPTSGPEFDQLSQIALDANKKG